MKSTPTWSSLGTGLIAISILGWVVIYLFYEIGQAPWQFLTIMVAFIGAVITFAGNLQIQIRNEQRPKKAEIYEKVISFFFDLIFAQKLGHPQKTEADIISFFAKINPDLILWASDEVLDSYMQFRRLALVRADGSQLTEPRAAILLFGKLILAIRKDLGHQNSNLNAQSILGVFVNDIDSLAG